MRMRSMMALPIGATTVLSLVLFVLLCPALAFTPATPLSRPNQRAIATQRPLTYPLLQLPKRNEDESGVENNDNDNTSVTLDETDQVIIGVVGSTASVVMLYSEYVLSQTGCGLPAGPLGLVGATEGLSYLSVLAIVGYSLYQKVTTGKALPSGKFGLLGLAEGLGFLAAAAGVVVLGLQVTNFGYIPNAIPMEGGMCQ